MLFYDTCLLIIRDGDINFGIIGLQTDNTLNVRIKTFINKEETEIIETTFKAKSQTMLKAGTSRNLI